MKNRFKKNRKVKIDRRKRERPKSYEKYEKSESEQLNLFRIAEADEDYSYTMEFYDFVPKFVWGKSERIQGHFLHPVERNFEYRNSKYKLVLMPAFIKEGESFTAYFPGRREELVEDALRKLMTERNNLQYLNNQASIKFTLYELQKELKQHNHNYSYDQLKDALEILTKTDIEIESEDGNVKLIFSPIETFGIKGQAGEKHTFVRFSPIVTQSIDAGTYRLLNYEKVMGYKSVIARQLHKRISHHFIQASITNDYTILLSTIIRDFGLKKQTRLQQNLQEVVKAIEEMKTSGVIWTYKIEKIFDGSSKSKQPKLLDAKFIINTTPSFVAEMKKANALATKIKSSIKTI